MNRLNLIQTGARADLPAAIAHDTHAGRVAPTRTRLIAPVTSFYLAIAGFVGCGAAVIVTTGLIALQIQ